MNIVHIEKYKQSRLLSIVNFVVFWVSLLTAAYINYTYIDNNYVINICIFAYSVLHLSVQLLIILGYSKIFNNINDKKLQEILLILNK